MISIYNSNLNLFMSPMADGPIKYTGTFDELKIDKITKYAKDTKFKLNPHAPIDIIYNP